MAISILPEVDRTYSARWPMLKAHRFRVVNPLLHMGSLRYCPLPAGPLDPSPRPRTIFLAFTEGDIGCAITLGDLKYVQKFAVRR